MDRSISNENVLPRDLFHLIVTLRDCHNCKKSKTLPFSDVNDI